MSLEYLPGEIEKKWQEYWRQHQVYASKINHDKPKFYVLDMFPYPSGAGLHVGHPLGYIASDILARAKRLQGFEVLHPMGYDAFGLPAEQYAIQTGQHPAVTTRENIQRYRQQLNIMGFSFDWNREIKTCDPDYYRWTQWIFLQLYNSWFNEKEGKAEPISTLIERFNKNGFDGLSLDNLTGNVELFPSHFTAEEWQRYSEGVKESILGFFRLAYLSDAWVNWCPALGTVLANDEVKDGFSERGGHPVVRKRMKQWSLRITAYADRLLKGLDEMDWPVSIKESQRNWIGKSVGCSVRFKVEHLNLDIEVFTTRPDTLYGVAFLTLAPEHELVKEITTPEQKMALESYCKQAMVKTERERQAEVKKSSGVFTGSYAIHPLSGERIPIWVGDYVLSGYGTGAVMAVPAHDSRDFQFAKQYLLPIIPVIKPPDEQNWNPELNSWDEKKGVMQHSGEWTGMEVEAAIQKAFEIIEAKGVGIRKINYRLRDAAFGRQRYWGEPIPVYYQNGLPKPLTQEELPLILPQIDSFLPTQEGEPPLARAQAWKHQDKFDFEWTTMPGWAGSSWYYLRYMDPVNAHRFASEEALNYWKQVDVYIGGAEHATGHLLYVRFWAHFLYDLSLIPFPEPAKKLVNQGMIQGRSNIVYRITGTQTFVSFHLKDAYQTTPLHVDVALVAADDTLDLERFKAWRDDFKHAEFILENGVYICGWEVEKMSKSKFNVVNPDDIIRQYGADTFRLYEMFLGPLEQSKPWSTAGIEGVSRFLKKFWRLFVNENGQIKWEDKPAPASELKIIHRTIKKITEDIEQFSFNTSVSAAMIAVNELMELNGCSKDVLKDFLIILSPFAPHICEEIWQRAGEKGSIVHASWPQFDPSFLIEKDYEYPVSVNGKTRTTLRLSLELVQQDIENAVMADQVVQKWLEGKTPKKIIFVKGRIINVVA